MSSENTQNSQLTFQQALNRLEVIVEELNNSNIELEQAMNLFKEGLSLSNRCEQQLRRFETEMNQLITADRTDQQA